MRGIVTVLVGLFGLLVGAAGGYYFAKQTNLPPQQTIREVTNIVTQPATQAAQLATSWKVLLSEQNKSGQAGVAFLTDENGKTRLSLTLISAPGASPSASQPAHIHLGSCPNPGAVKYPLNNVVNGSSETAINVTIDQLKSMFPLAINVHKSASDIGAYVACGDLK